MARRCVAIAGAALLGLEALAGGGARAQVPAPEDYAAPISLGGRGWSSPQAVRTAPERPSLEFSARAGIASDYIYRGTTLSDRGPAVGGGIEATFGLLYAGATAASVKLPSEPAVELTAGAGIRPRIGTVEFDLGATYFFYPGEAPGSAGIDYWEAAARADTRVGEGIRVAGGLAYAPDVSNTGAWSFYAAGGVGYDLPARLLPAGVGASFTAGAGYSWFGTQSAALGGFPLPDYLNWQAGVTFSRRFLNLDLRYYDSNLSKEDCYVFTGDPGAQPGGRVDPITNPAGLTSRWCGAAFVAKAWFALN